MRIEPHAVPWIPHRIQMQFAQIARRNSARLWPAQNVNDLHILKRVETFERLPYQPPHAAFICRKIERVEADPHFASCGKSSSKMSESALKLPCVTTLAHALFVLAYTMHRMRPPTARGSEMQANMAGVNGACA